MKTCPFPLKPPEAREKPLVHRIICSTTTVSALITLFYLLGLGSGRQTRSSPIYSSQGGRPPARFCSALSTPGRKTMFPGMAAPPEADSWLNRNLGGKEIKCKYSCVVVLPEPAGFKVHWGVDVCRHFLMVTRKCQWTFLFALSRVGDESTNSINQTLGGISWNSCLCVSVMLMPSLWVWTNLTQAR